MNNFPVRKLYHPPKWTTVLTRLLIIAYCFILLILIFVPWQQTSKGYGRIIAIDPNDRIQTITSNLPGRIRKWFVVDGSKVKKGDPIAEIIDNDPNYLEKLKTERDAKFSKYQAAKIAAETAYINYERQKDLFKQGLSARTKFEKAKISYKKLLSEEAEAAAKLANSEVKYSRQQSQVVVAPRDGTILKILHGSGSVVVKEGDKLAVFAPKKFNQAAEVYINGNDLPLVYPGRKVRLQFEGWPAVQLSGWPSVAIGTFSGVVYVVDPSASKDGKFRVIIKPEKGDKWPDKKFLRQGTRVNAWILLNTVKVGFEIWRQFNGFPPTMDPDYEKEWKKTLIKD